MSRSPVRPGGMYSTLIELLQARAQSSSDQDAYLYLEDGETQEASITYAELDRQARAIAAWLQDSGAQGERAVLLFPPGLEYLAAFFGCLYAGVVAVPAYPPRLNRPSPRLQSIAADCQATIGLTNAQILDNVSRRVTEAPDLEALRWLDTASLPAGVESSWRSPKADGESLAFLQYTSGSTRSPKGVMLSHANLLHNLEVIRQGMQFNPTGRGVFWLPTYHDMGLIGGILEALYIGGTSTLMSPVSFLQRPARWLEAISRYRATATGAPNFAFELCAEKATPELVDSLDLSSLQVTFCGAEPVRVETLERFAETFAPSGFSKASFYPCYGLAEATLLAAGGRGSGIPKTLSIKREALAENWVEPILVDGQGSVLMDERSGIQTLVSCGGALLDQEIAIVHPERLVRLPEGQVGEIWLRGGSVAQGYWNQPEESEATFRAYLRSEPDSESLPPGGPYLRTGDLGFLHEGQLYITGRLKDLIIIRGRNHYPQDIERSVERSHPMIQAGGGAAFSVDLAGEESLVIVQEVDRHYKKDQGEAVTAAIRLAVAEQHELQVYAIALVKTLSIPKTSSGKIQRHACKAGFLEGNLKTVFAWEAPARSSKSSSKGQEEIQELSRETRSSTDRSPDLVRDQEQALAGWLAREIAARLGLDPSAIDPHQPFAAYGLDSADAVDLSGKLETHLGRRLSPTLSWDYPNIASLARFLAAGESVAAVRSAALPGTGSFRDSGPVAIVGIGCRFPGADDPESFWALLRDGVDAIREVPPDRWPLEEHYDPDPDTPGRANTRWGGFLESIDRFDPVFFGIAPREAERMDPQQRLLLEVAWEALEYSGLPPDRLAGSRTGVFIGISSFDYAHRQLADPSLVDAYTGTGNAHSIAANRLSYLWDLRGPSVAIDTACSSSLVAVHLACQSLRSGEADLALAGGVNVILAPELNVAFSQARMLSPEGRCKTFDAGADGYVRGEGCGVVVLKRLADAQRDGDPILAIVRGTAINQDGRSNGLTAPNGPAQQAAIWAALDSAGVLPEQVGYIEAHGTGTPLGDPIEFEALKAVLANDEQGERKVALGSVKTNFGHLEAAAGIAGLIKAVLALQHGEIPPHLHLKEINPHISLEGTPFFIPTGLTPWPEGKGHRLAGVSSFGFGGTNAHAILEEGVPLGAARNDLERDRHLISLSAQSERALQSLAGRYTAFLESRPELQLADVCYSANTGRARFPYRLAASAGSSAELASRLAGFADGKPDASTFNGGPLPLQVGIAFLFTGQGSQYAGMGRRFYETQPVFRAALDRCAQLLEPELGLDLRAILFTEPANGESSISILDQTGYTQPALFALEFALAELWFSWGIEPQVVMGHSVGEFVAACLAGAFSLEDGLRLISARGRLMGALPEGGVMAAVFASREVVEKALNPEREFISIAATNGPENTVISGDEHAVERVLARLEAQGFTAQRLSVSHAFHSHRMEPALEALAEQAALVKYKPLRLPLVSNLTGQVIPPGERLDPGYWVAHARQPVRFAEGLAALSQHLARAGLSPAFVEIGPQPVLLGLARGTLPPESGLWLPSLRRGQADWEVLLDSLGSLVAAGLPVDWAGFESAFDRRKISLPTYPFERERYWLELGAKTERRSTSGTRSPDGLLQVNRLELASPGSLETWEGLLETKALPGFDSGASPSGIIPIASLLEPVLSACQNHYGGLSPALEQVSIHDLLRPEAQALPVQVSLSPAGERRVRFQAFARREDAGWQLFAEGQASLPDPAHLLKSNSNQSNGLNGSEKPADGPGDQENFTTGMAPVRLPLNGHGQPANGKPGSQEQDEALSASGFQQLAGLHLPGMPEIERAWLGPDGSPGARPVLVELPVNRSNPAGRQLLAGFDSGLQLLASVLASQGDEPVGNGVTPTGISSRLRLAGFGSFQVQQPVAIPGLVYALPGPSGHGGLAGDVLLYSQEGDLVAFLVGCRFEVHDSQAEALASEPVQDWLYRVVWRLDGRLDQRLPRPTPAYLLTPEEIAKQVAGSIPELAEEVGLKDYGIFLESLESLSANYVHQALVELGGDPQAKKTDDPDSLAIRLGVLPQHLRLFRRMCTTPHPLVQVTPSELRARFPRYGAELALLERCGPELAGVLRGQVDPLDLLLLGGSLELVEAFYQDSPVSQAFNRLLAESVNAALSRLASGRSLRILEVGAGTGATTAALLPVLPADRVEYVLTDVSSAFTAHLAEKFAGKPFLRAAELDIERDPAGQGFASGQFDLVLAANVLHATEGLRSAVEHALSLLAPGGLLLLIEGSAPLLWLDLVFGLTEGWWKFADLELRPDYPLLSTVRWRELLSSIGCDSVALLPGEESELARQAVILARAPAIAGEKTGTDVTMAPAKDTGRWLVIDREGGLGSSLINCIQAGGGAATLLLPGPGLRAALQAEFQGTSDSLRGVVHLWSPLSPGTGENLEDSFATSLSSELLDAVAVLQELGRVGGKSSPRLCFATRGAQPVAPGEIVDPAQAALWGLAQVAAQEHPNLHVTLVDLDPEDSLESAGETLWAELAAPDPADQVAFRAGGRFTPRLARLSLPESPKRHPAFRPDASYLITGGLGDLGLETARWLVAGGARRLVLLGRKRLPPRRRWGSLKPGSPAGRRVAAIRALEAAGASIHLVSLDVADKTKMAAFLERFRSEGWPPIRGVFHLAGVTDDRLIRELDPESLASVLRPKVFGAWNLHQLLEEPLDFFVLFSSAGTVLGQPGQGSYAAANAFLDALAHHRQARRLPALAVDWGAWQALGFAIISGGRRLLKRLALQGIRTIPPERAMHALGLLMDSGIPQSAVLPIDWDRFQEYLPEVGLASLLADLLAERRTSITDGSQDGSLDRESLLAARPGERHALAQSYLARRVARVLGLPIHRLDLQRPLDSLGLDSLMAVELKNRVASDLGLNLPMVEFLQGPTIGQLAEKLLQELDEASSAPVIPLESILREGGGEFPLSYGQRSMWFLNQLAPESPAYNVVFPAYVRSPVDVAALRRAFQALLDRHPILRTTLHVRDAHSVQRVHPRMQVAFEVTEAAAWPLQQVDDYLYHLVHRPFDLERGPVLRVDLLRLGPQESVLVFIVHHIAIDFWSLVGLVEELGRHYAAELSGEPARLPELAFQYVDYATWQEAMLASPRGERLLAYWQEKLAGEVPALDLPTDRPRPMVQTYNGQTLDQPVSQGLAGQLKALALAEGVTLNMLLVAAFKALLYRYTGQEDLPVGTLATGRSRAEFESVVGYFVNPIVLRSDLSGNPPFREFLSRVRGTVLDALAGEDAPFPLLVERLQPARDASRTPLFQVMFIMLQPRHLEQEGVSQFFMGKEGAQMRMGGLALESFHQEQRTAMFDLTLTIVEAGGELSAHWNYNTDLFDPATIQRMAGHFDVLLKGIVEDPSSRLLDLPLLPEGERRQLLENWNDTARTFPQDVCFQQLFEAQARETPDEIAAIFNDQSLTYDQLNRRANRLAHFLVDQEVGRDCVVALLGPRDLDLLTAILAVFKAGGAYLPLDPLHPPERIAQVLRQSAAAIVLTAGEFKPLVEEAIGRMMEEGQPSNLPHFQSSSPLLFITEDILAQDRPEDNLGIRAGPDDLAYVIFTSGSTGLPKGAMVEHKGMLNHLFAKIGDLDLIGRDVIAETASQCFDISVWQFLACLLTGGRVHIFDDETAHDPWALLDGCVRGGITILETVPSFMRAMLQGLSSEGNLPKLKELRWMIPTGEELPPELARQWLHFYPQIPLMNAYGPTECSDDVSHYPILGPPAPQVVRMPVGRPIANMRLYILDRALQPAPAGVNGELCVGGVGVGRGYLNDPDRTAQAFGPDPFSVEPGARLYRTGDLARFLPDGNIEFLGRIDHQVKIRGFRIELEEIETVLEQHSQVRESAVLAREDIPGDKRLVAYVVLDEKPETALDPAGAQAELRAYLKQRLPEYMVPSAFVLLEALPLTSNGKLNRKALPAPEGGRAELGREYLAPRTPLEEQLAGIWAQVLNLERVGVYDNFFELGGDSILALQAIARAGEQGLQFTPRQILQCQTVAELATVANSAPPILADQGLVTGPVPLMPIQRWFFEQDLPNPGHYNQAILLEILQPLEPAALEAVLQQLASHHDALRLRFTRTESGWQQTAGLPDQRPLVVAHDLPRGRPEEQAAFIEAEAARAQYGLDLENGPLLRAVLFQAREGEPGRLLLLAHHLVVDAVSWRVLLEDLYSAYLQFSQGQAIQLPPKTSSFRLWAERLAEFARAEALDAELPYWLDEARDRVPLLPTDSLPGTRPNTFGSARTIWSLLSPERTRQLLQETPAVYRTGPEDLLLAALGWAIFRWSGASNLLIDLESHGRAGLFEDVDLSRTVGWFTSLYPVHLDLGDINGEDSPGRLQGSTAGELIKSVKEQLRRVPDGGLGYGLLRYLRGDTGLEAHLQAGQQAQVSFNYLGQLDQALPPGAPFRLAQESPGPLHDPGGLRRYLIDVTASVIEGQLNVAWTYSQERHLQSTVSGLAHSFLGAVDGLIAHCLEPEAGGYTPSDFPDAGIDQESLDRVIAEILWEDDE